MTRYETNAPRIVWDRADGEVVAVDCITGVYYRFTPAASDLWEALAAGATAEELAAAGGVAPADVAVLLEGFVADELLRPAAADSAGPDLSGWALGDGTIEVEKLEDLREMLEADPIHEVDPATGWTLGRG